MKNPSSISSGESDERARTILEVARQTGLRSYLQGVNATFAREMLTIFFDAATAALATQPAPAEPVKCGIHYVGGLHSTWGCDVCGYKEAHDSHPGCRRPATQPAESKACAAVGVEPSDGQIDALFTQEKTMHTFAEDYEHFLAYTQNVPADERLRLAYEHGDYRGRGRPKHKSDCAVHNEPAYPAGPCDCEAGS